MFGGSSQLPTTTEHVVQVIKSFSSDQTTRGAADHLIDSSEKRICLLSGKF